MHYLDPFNNGVKNYEITDIVYAYLSEQPKYQETEVIIVNSGQPDRAKITKLVNRLSEAGAKVIGLDFFFQELRGNKIDTLLQESLKKAGNVVLACELYQIDDNNEQFDRIIGVDTFFSNHAQLGYVNFPANATKTIRIFSPREKVEGTYFPAFTSAIMQQYNTTAYQGLINRGNDFERIFYIGNKDDFTRYELSQLTDTLSVEEVSMVVKDKIVLVGYAAEDIWANPLTDRHYTPLNKNYSGKSIPDMYGVVIHANVLSMVLRSNYIREVPRWLNILLTIIFCYFNVLLIHWIYKKFHETFHGITRALQVIEFMLLFLLIALLFYYFRLKLEFQVGILALVLAYDIIMIYESLIKNRIPFLARIPNHFSFRRPVNENEEDVSNASQTPEIPVSKNEIADFTDINPQTL
ncbi:MAG: CHASE2 domain-containing protein, partial [Bacteroidota bacterium]